VKILEQLKELSKQRYVSAYSLAIFYLRFGDKEEALRWLEKVIKIEPALTLPLSKLTPFSTHCDGGPRFEALVEKIVSAWCKVTRVNQRASLRT
jgi:hypothetical protein